LSALKLATFSLLLALFGLFFVNTSYALVETAKTSVSVQSLSGNVDSQNTLAVQNSISQTQQNFEFDLEGIQRNFTVSGSMTIAQPDYSDYLVTERNGVEAPLTSQTSIKQEYSAASHLNWNSGSHNATVGWSGSASSSPFWQQSADASYTETFFNKTTAIGIKGSMGVLRQPTDYFVDLNFITEQRPLLIHSNSAGLTVDQVLAERYRIQFEGDTSDREEDRPRNVGGTFRQSYALADRLFARLDLARISELHFQPLLNERGYFSLNSAEIFLTSEPWIDFLVTGSYGYVVENESDPRSGREVQIGSDQFGIGLKYRHHAWSYQTKAAYRVSNTGIHDTFVQGGLEWQI
jgi:hypothetical protein